MLSNLWLGLGDVRELVIDGNMLGGDWEKNNKVAELIVKTCLNPEYIHFFTKNVLNVDIFPFQAVALKMLWEKKFPMFLFTRGGSKCVIGSELTVGPKGLLRMDELIDSSSIVQEKQYYDNLILHGENGDSKVEYGWNNGITNTKIISTRFGYSLEGTSNHPIRIIDTNGQYVWRDLSAVQEGDIVCINRDNYDFGPHTKEDIDFGWWIGATLGDGMVSQKGQITLSNLDDDIINEWSTIGNKLSGKQIRKVPSNIDAHVIYSAEFSRKVNLEWGLNYAKAYDKTIPKIIRESRSRLAGCISGLFDTDGGFHDRKDLKFTTVSSNMAQQVQTALLTFGIVSRRLLRDYTCQTGKFKAWNVVITGVKNLIKFRDQIGFRCQRKQKALVNACQKQSNTNVDILPRELIRSDFMELRQAWCGIRLPTSEYSYEQRLFAISRFEKYQISYDTLQKMLDITQSLSHLECWQNLNKLIRSHLFYDRVIAIKDGFAQTFDVHIPQDHSFISSGFISHNSFVLAIYIAMRAVLSQGCTIAVTGSSLRQSMILYNYIENIWNNAPILRDICGGKNGAPKKELHMCSWRCGSSKVIFLPIGDGEKIRGQRANIVVCDEFASLNPQIFEKVIRGFAAVRSQGVHSHAVRTAKLKYLREKNPEIAKELEQATRSDSILDGNQIIISGTADFQFGHFYKYYRIYKAIITSGGDTATLMEDFPDLPLDLSGIDSRDYAILRIPYDKVQEGMMDETILNQGRATIDPIIFAQEYGVVFPSDSEGFILASLIRGATCPIGEGDNRITFTVKRKGDPDKQYIMGVDPASEDDNFAISIIELDGNTRKFVYCWTTNRHKFEKDRREHLVDDSIKDYHTFCVKHVRDLCNRFNIHTIVMDKGGGGLALKEGLKDPDKMGPGELPIFDMDDLLTINERGRRILKMIDFSDSKWRHESHYGLRTDIIDKLLLFPENDSAEMLVHTIRDGKGYDTVEDTYDEILECIQETIMVKRTVTPASNTERWDVPKIMGLDEEEKKKQLKKDRFTSLLLANWGCRLANIKAYSVDSSVYTSVKRNSFNQRKDAQKVPCNIRTVGNRKILF